MFKKLLAPKSERAVKPRTLDAPIQWGGYYAHVENGQYRVSRLLDFNKDVQHCTLYKDTFDHVPSLQEAQAAQPAILHVPIAAHRMFNEEDLTLLGGPPLDLKALEGYRVYLEHQGQGEKDIESFLHRVIGFSNELPMLLRLFSDGTQIVHIEPISPEEVGKKA